MEQKFLTDYRVTPAVVVVGECTTVTIRPRGEQAAFLEGGEYTVEIWPHETTTTRLNIPTVDKYTVTAQHGVLQFTHTFPREQGYTLKLKVPEAAKWRENPHYNPPFRPRPTNPKSPYACAPYLFMYAVDPDWKGMTVHKGDMHLHTNYSDGNESVGGLLANLRAAGYDFAAVTDHYCYDSSLKAIEWMKELPDVLTAVAGEEIHCPKDYVHILSIGGTASVNTCYDADPEKADAAIAAIAASRTFPEGVDPQNAAARHWVVRKIKEVGGMAVLTHPFWLWERVHFMPLAMTEYLFRSGEYDVYEMLNGISGPECNQLETMFYYDQQRQGYTMPVIGNSDCHCSDRPDFRKPAPAFTLVLSKERDWESLRDAILARRSVAVEWYEGDTNFRIHGDFRMVKYMNFLMRNYYPLYMELCHAQGMLMKQYDDTRDIALLPLLEGLKKQTDTFTEEFFGW